MFEDFLSTEADKMDKWAKSLRILIAKAKEYENLKTLLNVAVEKCETDGKFKDTHRIVLTLKPGVHLDTESALKAADARIEEAGKNPDPKEVCGDGK